MKGLLIACLAGLAVLLTGCESRTEEVVKARSTAEATLPTDKRRTTVTAKLFQAVTLHLPPVEAPGYRWELFAHDARFLKQTTEVVSSLGGRPTVTFLTLRLAPRTALRFLLVREDRAKEDQPIDSYDVVFTVQ